ncbi:MAG: DUF3078 domain-containing protein [Porphyromonas sp.]|nr:DUF3078 domain-containing protein [Porphyromonas sp.]
MKAIKYIGWVIGLVTIGHIAVPESQAQNFASTPDYLTNILLNDTLGGRLSSEAKRIIGRPFAPDQMTVTPEQSMRMAFLKAPKVLDAASFATFKLERPEPVLEPLSRHSWVAALLQQSDEVAKNSRFSALVQSWSDAQMVRERAMLHTPRLADIMLSQLPGTLVAEEIQGEGYKGQLAYTEAPKIEVEEASLQGETVKRKYWWHHFEGSVQFAQNEISKNWHKGGYNSINLNSRLYYNGTYERDRVKWVNEIEYRLGVFSNDVGEEEKRRMKIGEDLFRAYSNLGIKAFDYWYYTVYAQLRSQLLSNSDAEGHQITRPFAPFGIDGGIGMKYDLDIKSFRGNPFSRIQFNANVAPFAMDLVYTYTDDIDKGRVGLTEDQRSRFRFGSSVRLNLNWDFSSSLNWTSRVFYNTSYKHVEVEFDNSLSYSFNKFLSARLTLNTRFDDSVILPEGQEKNFKNLFQYNQLISIGFAYKI